LRMLGLRGSKAAAIRTEATKLVTALHCEDLVSSPSVMNQRFV